MYVQLRTAMPWPWLSDPIPASEIFKAIYIVSVYKVNIDYVGDVYVQPGHKPLQMHVNTKFSALLAELLFI